MYSNNFRRDCSDSYNLDYRCNAIAEAAVGLGERDSGNPAGSDTASIAFAAAKFSRAVRQLFSAARNADDNYFAIAAATRAARRGFADAATIDRGAIYFARCLIAVRGLPDFADAAGRHRRGVDFAAFANHLRAAVPECAALLFADAAIHRVVFDCPSAFDFVEEIGLFDFADADGCRVADLVDFAVPDAVVRGVAVLDLLDFAALDVAADFVLVADAAVLNFGGVRLVL